MPIMEDRSTMEDRFREVSADYLGSFLGRIEASVVRLSEEQVWWRPNPAANSVGNHLLHLQGNLSQWVLAGLGGAPYERHRRHEFTAQGEHQKRELLDGTREVIERCQAVIRALPAEQFLASHCTQGCPTDGIHTVIHVVEHTSYHTGQILQIVKELLGPEAQIEFFPQHRNE
jgi:uncharacterized damage-inducible protein DinB